MSLSAEQAVNCLQSLTLTPMAAVDSLEVTLSSITILGVFEHFFPRDLKRLKSLETAIPVFLQLVNARLFPLHAYILYEWQEYGVLEQIPLSPINDDWWELEREDLHLFTRAVIDGAGIAENSDLWNGDWPSINYKKLAQLSGGPLKNLPDAVRVVFHRTGNAWLDAVEEEITASYDPWSIEACENLADMWRHAKPILDRSGQVYRYVYDHPAAALKVSRLVASCVIKPKKNGADPEAATLVRVLV